MDASAPRDATHAFTTRKSLTGMTVCDHCGCGFYDETSLAPCGPGVAQAEQDRVWETVREASR